MISFEWPSRHHAPIGGSQDNELGPVTIAERGKLSLGHRFQRSAEPLELNLALVVRGIRSFQIVHELPADFECNRLT